MGLVDASLALPYKPRSKTVLPLHVILQLTQLLKKSVFSRKFYQEINDKVLSKTSTVDQNLYFLCYFSLLISAILNNKYNILQFLREQRYKLLQIVKSGAGKLGVNTSESKILNQPKPVPVPESQQKPSQLAFHLKKINSYLADVRIFNRLTDSIKYMPWAIDEFQSWRNPSATTPKVDRFVNFVQAVNCIVLELFENAGWLTDHDWVGTGDNPYWCIETYIWCCRVWGAYLVIEIVELLRRTPVSKWSNKTWQITLFKNAIQLPLVLHWCLRDGCLTPFWVGLCGCGASWWNFKDMWKSIDLS
ncbi:hypothetical protein PVL30_004421 [Lodderomyces elongisporus]|uniref:Uncharacterized protein n=1 Tax=Lodderomyces elongisporus (strain ATCC 11503 / CBS 2605 / JCM 1781 / NBRC 1676 / NRRL YB-4239) TaxID=379508 RepID=A5E7S5_LODEL|nr:uncharacterized protein PVL30_004421 [Lodderomyces elongisporus]EDK47483.1 hypothetical protein LELG_05664 [Lodderomyces elongisporus NRRL YB-4239]WLF80636.1 hypothetical protein PVL30_004421 [Lodderomyces elongisporus]